MVQGYCFKDKKKVDLVSPVYELNARGRPVVRGACKVCGGKVYAMLSTADAPAELKAKMAKKGGSRSSTGSRKSRKSPKRKSRKSAPKRRSRKSRR